MNKVQKYKHDFLRKSIRRVVWYFVQTLLRKAYFVVTWFISSWPVSAPLAAVSVNNEIPQPSVSCTGANKPGRKLSDIMRIHPSATISLQIHDDVIKWNHFPPYWPFMWWIPVNSSHKGQWGGALMLSLICAWINSWVNGDLRRHRAHYDVTVKFWHGMNSWGLLVHINVSELNHHQFM